MRGRPREFDAETALDRALEVFWRKGYEGASLSELTEKMGISRPSLYAAFGNKEELFRKALDRYTKGPAAYNRDVLNEPTARGVAERLLKKTAEYLTDPCHPPGCLGVQGALSCSEAAESIKKELCGRRAAMEAALKERFERAKQEGDLEPGASPADLALYLATVTQGMSVQAAGGATRDALLKVAAMSLRGWPFAARAAPERILATASAE
jgi:AcrR family transcriptional regulator